MLMLGIKDQNITYDNTMKKWNKVKTNGTTNVLFNLRLTYPMRCKNCGYFMNKNGFKTVHHKGPITEMGLTTLNIKKQKYICKKCKNTAIAVLKDINKSDHILRCIKVKAALKYKDNVSIKYIAKDFGISSNTVLSQAKGLAAYHKIGYHFLPKNIAFDDFKSGKMARSGMSIALMNSDTHNLIDIIQSRQGNYLESYFLRYSSIARQAVKTITVDLFSPYRGIIKRVFPNAEIIADRFHVINRVYTALNQERIRVMKVYGSGTPEYRQLKSLYKLLFKNENDLNYTIYKPRRNFKYAHLTDSDIVERLLELSPSLRDAYMYYQDLHYIVTKTHNQNELDYILNPQKYNKQYPNLPKTMKNTIKTLKKHQCEIINSFKYRFSNGPLEGINNKIKVINRTAYGYRNFQNFKLRILVSFSKTYFSRSYNQKAIEFIQNSIA